MCRIMHTRVTRSLVTICLNHSSIVKRHHDQGNYYKRTLLVGGLAYSSRGLVRYHVSDHGSRQVDTGTITKDYSLMCRQRLWVWQGLLKPVACFGHAS